jgi:hypothetical protein
MRRSRLLPGRTASSGCPRSITGPRVIDVNARHSEREVGVVVSLRLGAWRPLSTQLGSADQPTRPLGDVLPVPEGQPLTPFGRAAVHAHEDVQAVGIDERKSGEIDDEPDRVDRSRVKLALEPWCSRSVKRTGQPDDRHVWLTLPAHDQGVTF